MLRLVSHPETSAVAPTEMATKASTAHQDLTAAGVPGRMQAHQQIPQRNGAKRGGRESADAPVIPGAGKYRHQERKEEVRFPQQQGYEHRKGVRASAKTLLCRGESLSWNTSRLVTEYYMRPHRQGRLVTAVASVATSFHRKLIQSASSSIC